MSVVEMRNEEFDNYNIFPARTQVKTRLDIYWSEASSALFTCKKGYNLRAFEYSSVSNKSGQVNPMVKHANSEYHHRVNSSRDLSYLENKTKNSGDISTLL